MEEVEQFLRSIGLGKNESIIYIHLVKRGVSSVLDISKETKIHRSNIYETLRILLEKGLIYSVSKNKKKFYYARQPISLLAYLKNKEVELGPIIKKLEETHSKPLELSSVRMSKGRFALTQALMSLLDCKKSISIYGTQQNAPEVIGPAFDQFHSKRVKKKIDLREIYNRGLGQGKDTSRILNKMDYTESRHLPSRYDSPVSTAICGEKVILFVWTDKSDITVIEINNQDVAIAYQNYFEILWESSIII